MTKEQELHLTVFELRETAKFLKNQRMFHASYLAERTAKLLEEFVYSASQEEREKLETMIGLPIRIAKDHGQQ